MSVPFVLGLLRYWQRHPPANEIIAWAYGWQPPKQSVIVDAKGKTAEERKAELEAVMRAVNSTGKR